VAARVIDVRRAIRSDVAWSARVRRFNEAAWHNGFVLNMSVTGALLELACRCEVGEWLAVEIEFPGTSGSTGVLARCGPIVRKPREQSRAVAIHFLLSGAPTEGAQSDRRSGA
jgi:hypothetical protein